MLKMKCTISSKTVSELLETTTNNKSKPHIIYDLILICIMRFDILETENIHPKQNEGTRGATLVPSSF